ncbi:hypothetical protein [Nostoc flagelliforme]|uniref:hypothetical protein n=1 Tax=Nostoc flagelliforme TaxID=1306274 RepID=UPI001F555725|nr:hypothetical protein [Nostoc flagelliforme]
MVIFASPASTEKCGENHGVWQMKRDRHGKAKVLSHEEIQILFANGLKTLRDRHRLMAVTPSH